MADVDEDVMPRGGHGEDGVDLSDETQDFRFLTSISREDATIPKRGEKDFEPHATALQSNILASSRQAMHNALSYQRVHAPKGHTVGTYHPKTNMAYAINPKGPLFAKMGQVLSAKDDPFGDEKLRGQRMWLLPEEVLYLLERGTLDVRWPATADDPEALGLPMSLQAAYAMFLGDEFSHGGALTFERYSVYAGLKRMGYTVMRAPSWDSPGPPTGPECFPPPQRTWEVGLLNPTSLWRMLFSPSPSPHDPVREASGPIIPPGLYRDYATIYRRLALINFHDPTIQQHQQPPTPTPPPTSPSFRITYHVWKPNAPHFKKSRPVDPDFRVAVIDARETRAPTLSQLSALLESAPWDPPKSDAHMHAKLKHGYRNVILAVVDQGVTSYLRVADSSFGREKVFERNAGRGGKRGGRGGGRGGRGRGRGR